MEQDQGILIDNRVCRSLLMETPAICRVCRGESSVNQPLYHPCKCSGSIRYIHQECLIQWLSLSNKKYCELCEYTFVFTPIYREDMPTRIPLSILLKQSLSHISKGFIVLIRSTIAAVVWLMILPVLTYNTWKFYFWSKENAALHQHTTVDRSLYIWSYPWRELLADCFCGLVIMVVVVIVFVAAYSFREWVVKNTMQNTRENPEENQISQVDSDESTTSSIERNRMNSRLEELRRELENRRRLNNTDEDENAMYNDNPYTGIRSPGVVGYYQTNPRSQVHSNSDPDIDYINPPSGTQSPFITWRDYQQDNRVQAERSLSSQLRSEEEPRDYFPTSPEPPTNEDSNDVEPPVSAQANNDNANQDNFDFVEDIDGILEAIGVRGNPLILIKNSVLMALMINLCLCVTVWIPYMIGRSLIQIHPPSLFDSSVSLLRLKLEPVVFLRNVLLPMVKSAYKSILPASTIHTIKSMNSDMLSGLYFIFKSIHIALLDQSGSDSTLAQLISDTTNNVINASKIYDWSIIKDNVVSISAVIFKRWRACASGQGHFDRAVCTCLGYIVLISIGSFYLSRHKRSRPGSTNEILHQQAVFIKVLFCTFLELVLFPTVCGFLLDISTFPLFTQWSIKSRFHFFLLNPYTSTFLHWFVGTGFVLQYSIFISLVREVVRPGVIFFMRDQNGPQFHPVQDMVDQPILILLKQLIITAGIYFMLIMVGMGLVTLLVSRYGGIYPIIWKFDIPISSLPIDLLAIHFLLAPLMSYIVPREFSKKNVSTWWHVVSRHLRLSSYMFGGRYPEEEDRYVYKSWCAWISYTRQNNVQLQKDGQLVRVPAYDNVPLIVPRRRMIVPIEATTLQPLDETERRLGHPAVVNNEDQDTTIVYLPPHFTLRIIVFLLLIWTTGSILLCSISVMPLKLGRNLFSKLSLDSERQVHDLYSFGLGAFIMIFLSTLLNTIIQKYHVVETDGGRIHWIHVKDYLLDKIHKITKFVYFFVMFGFVIPFFIGIMLDLYIFMPLRSYTCQDKIELYLTIDWAFGVIGFSIFYGLVSFLPNTNALKLNVIRLNWRNFDQLDMKHTTTKIILPTILYLLMAISLPYSLSFIITKIYSVNDSKLKIAIFQYIYPVIFCMVCFMALIILLVRLINMWLLRIRDDIYLINRQLNNFEEN